MPGEKKCSTGVLDHLFEYIYEDGATSSLRFCVVSSTGELEVAGCSSPRALVVSTGGPGATLWPGTSWFTLLSSGDNRCMTISACSCDDVYNSGNAAAVVIFSTAKNEVIYATTCTTQALTAGSKVNIGSWTITVNQPT